MKKIWASIINIKMETSTDIESIFTILIKKQILAWFHWSFYISCK